MQNLDERGKLEAHLNKMIRYADCEPDPDESIHFILDFLGKTLYGDKVYIIERTASEGNVCTYEWSASDATTRKSPCQDYAEEIVIPK